MERAAIAGKASVLRSINRSVVLNVVRSLQPISRARIAKLTGLNPSTVSEVTSGLLKDGLIYERISGDHGVGRAPINLYLKSDGRFIGAINIGVVETVVAIADIGGEVKIASSICPNPKVGPAESVRSFFEELLQLMNCLGIRELHAVAVTVSGIVDPAKATILSSAGLGWQNVEIGDLARDIFPDTQAIVVSDVVKGAAMAEILFGHHESDLSNFVFLTIGDSIDAAIFVDGHTILGENFSSGDLSHMVAFEGGLPCECGIRGCWEAYVSNRATVLRYQSMTGRNEGVDFESAFRDILKRAAAGDESARRTIEQTGRFLGIGITTILKTIEPTAVVIGGKILDAWVIHHPEILKVLDERLQTDRRRLTKVLRAANKDPLGVTGAVALAVQRTFDGYKITEPNPSLERR